MINLTQSVINTFTANLGLFLFLTFVWILSVYYAAWHCLTRLKGIDRLTWLIAILGIPYLGIVFYLMVCADEGGHSRLTDKQRWGP